MAPPRERGGCQRHGSIPLGRRPRAARLAPRAWPSPMMVHFWGQGDDPARASDPAPGLAAAPRPAVPPAHRRPVGQLISRGVTDTAAVAATLRTPLPAPATRPCPAHLR